MKVVDTVAAMHRVRDELPGPVSMMATLGGMHAGHESLLQQARALGTSLVASLFLNPTQFNDPRDLETYPADRGRDLALFEQHGVDVVFAPTVDEMYPQGASTTVDPGPLAAVLEGAHRPGHFHGVATVVTKILTVIRPDVAVWGAKDAQQNVIIRRISGDLGMHVRHVLAPTVRDEDGLALSSRNARLSAAERVQAASLYRGLSGARALWHQGTRDAARLVEAVRRELGRHPLVCPEYVSLADPDTLTELHEARPGALLSVAAVVGATRLIDNITLD